MITYPYNSYYPPYPQQPAQTVYQSMLSNQKMEIVKVNGKNGAEAYQMPPNSSILLLDESAPIVWLKTTDGAGYPTITPYSISPYREEPHIDTKSLETRIARLEGIINVQSYATPNEYDTDEATNTETKASISNSKRASKSSGNA